MATSRPPAHKKKREPATPTLTWPGKHLPAALLPPPAPRLIECFAPSANAHEGLRTPLYPIPHSELRTPNLLYLGDNLHLLNHLLATGYRGQVKLIYIDPPFASGLQWGRKVRLRGAKAPTMQTRADQVFGTQVQYNDRWGENGYLQFIYERLPLLRELLCEAGSLWLHSDHRQVHHLRVLLQEVFGAENYLNTITWRSQVARGTKVNAFYFPASAHYLTVFAKDRRAPTTFHPSKKQLVLSEAEAKRSFMRDPNGFFRTSDPGDYSFASLKTLHDEGRLYAPFGGEIVIDEAMQRVYASQGGNIGVKYYLSALGQGKWAVERAVDNVWDDIPGLGTTPGEEVGYPTQKTAALLERVIRTASDPGDLVLDCFMGSGTTLAVAEELGRRWIGCDNNRGALITTRRRLHAQINETDAPTSAGFAIYTLQADKAASSLPTGEQAKQASPSATLTITRNAHNPATITVTLTGYQSPAIVDQLAAQGKAPMDNWRVLVDCVAIDPAYAEPIFSPALVDAPLKKNVQVQGSYTLPVSATSTTVAVRITDVLGDEVLITQVV